jgi:hypothetical protein
MIIKELEFKERFDNKYGKSSCIKEYCYYDGSEQIAIYISNGFGPSEQTQKVIISEHELKEFLEEFKTSTIKVKPKIIMENNPTIVNKNTLQSLLLESMIEVKNGTLSTEKAKSIAMIGQTLINSVKVEIEYNKAFKNGNHKLL